VYISEQPIQAEHRRVLD